MGFLKKVSANFIQLFGQLYINIYYICISEELIDYAVRVYTVEKAESVRICMNILYIDLF